MKLVDEVIDLVHRALPLADDEATASILRTAADRLNEPLRVALVGRAKAGKSTLLNALVGDLVAPTDAAECTLLPTEYHDGLTYRAWKVALDGDIKPARFLRDEDGAHIELDTTAVEDLSRLLVEFPSPLLRTLTLVDTPGLGSISQVVSRRTVEFTSSDELAPADAVVYLLRNWHAVDSEFLMAFHDRVGVDVPPVSSVAVLSRADEVGGGDRDALDQAADLARTLADDPTLRSLVVNVVPVAGLLAQSAATLSEHEFRDVTLLASIPVTELEESMISVDRFVATDRLKAVDSGRRRQLLEDLGLYGVRRAIEAVRLGHAISAQALSEELTRASGLDELRRIIFGQFADHAPVVKAARVLDLIETAFEEGDLAWDPDLAEALERVRVNAQLIVELRALNEVLCSRDVMLSPGARTEIARLLGGEGAHPRARLQLDGAISDEAVLEQLRREIHRWQAATTDATRLPDEQRLARIVVRSLTAQLMSNQMSSR